MTSHQPLYQSLAAELEHEIRVGRWKPGDRLPTEVELMQLHGMGRVTVRHALDLLRDKKLIERFPQRGSIVQDPSLAVGVRSMETIGEVVRLGMETRTEPIAWRLINAPRAATVFFGKEHRQVFKLHGIRSKKNMAVYTVTSFVRADLGARISREELSDHTPLELIRNMKVRIDHGDEEVWAEKAGAKTAAELRIAPGSVVIVEQRRVYGHGSLPLLLSTTWWRTDQYRRISRIGR